MCCACTDSLIVLLPSLSPFFSATVFAVGLCVSSLSCSRPPSLSLPPTSWSVQSNLSGFGNAVGTSASCVGQAFLLQFGDLSSVLWTAAMSFNLLLVLFMTRTARDLESLERYYFFGCFGVAFLFAFLPIFVYNPERGLAYGDVEMW